MKTVKLASILALVTTSLVPVSIATPTLAAVPTESDMQTVCNALIPGADPAALRMVVVAGSTTEGAVERVPGSLTQDVNPHADLSAVPTPVGAFSFQGIVGKNGQSPNLFSAIAYSQAAYPKLVDVQEDQQRTDTYSFGCQSQEWQVVGTHTETVPNPDAGTGNPGHGDCIGNPSDGDRENGRGPGQGAANANENSACNRPATIDIEVDDYGWVDAGAPVEQSLTDTVHLGWATISWNEARPFEAPIVVAGHYPAGTVVVCNSPGSKGGSWRPQNTYGGANCSTTYFQAPTTPWLNGVENKFHSNSLPTL